MKKKILFVLNQMGAGGIAKSLNNLLYYLEEYKDDYDIDLFLLRKDGCYMNDIPDYVNVIEAKGLLKLFGASQKDTKKFGKWQTFKRFCVAGFSKAFTNYLPLKYGVKQNVLKQEYDCAISFAHTQSNRCMAAGSVEFVLWGVKAKKKFCVLHSDVVKEKLLSKSNIKKFTQFNKLFSVSKSCSLQVSKICPKLAPLCDYLYNTQRNDIIINKSGEFKVEDEEVFNLLMVSRLEKEKAHLRFLPIIKKLHNEGFAFNLHIVGDGSFKHEIEAYLDENNMWSYVKLYGEQKNPYPYFKMADLFVLVSYYEAAPMVYNESLLLGTPIFTTNIISAHEMIQNYGFICDNSEKAIYEMLKHVLSNKELIKEKKKLLENYNYNNYKIIEKLLNSF